MKRVFGIAILFLVACFSDKKEDKHKIELLSPSDQQVMDKSPVQLFWQSEKGNDNYELLLWQDGQNPPTNYYPNKAEFQLRGLDKGKKFIWQVKQSNSLSSKRSFYLKDTLFYPQFVVNAVRYNQSNQILLEGRFPQVSKLKVHFSDSILTPIKVTYDSILVQPFGFKKGEYKIKLTNGSTANDWESTVTISPRLVIQSSPTSVYAVDPIVVHGNGFEAVSNREWALGGTQLEEIRLDNGYVVLRASKLMSKGKRDLTLNGEVLSSILVKVPDVSFGSLAKYYVPSDSVFVPTIDFPPNKEWVSVSLNGRLEKNCRFSDKGLYVPIAIVADSVLKIATKSYEFETRINLANYFIHKVSQNVLEKETIEIEGYGLQDKKEEFTIEIGTEKVDVKQVVESSNTKIVFEVPLLSQEMTDGLEVKFTLRDSTTTISTKVLPFRELVSKPLVERYGSTSSDDLHLTYPAYVSQSEQLVWMSPQGLLIATDLNGNKVWNKHLLPRETLNGFSFDATPVVDNEGNIYVASMTGEVYKIAFDGTLVWKVSLSGEIRGKVTFNKRQDRVYLANRNGKVFALNTSDGSKVWEYDTKERIAFSQILVMNDQLFFGNDAGNFYRLNADGLLVNKVSLDGDIETNPVPSLDKTKVYVATESGKVYLINVQSGAVEGVFDVGAKISDGLTIDGNGRVLVSTVKLPFKIVKLSADLSQVIATREFEDDLATVPISMVDKRMLINSFDDYVYALGENLEVIWKLKTDGNLKGMTCLQNKLFFGTSSGQVYVLQLATLGLPTDDWNTLGGNLQNNANVD